MPRLSPGVYINEYDFSEYAPQLGLATLAVVGGATKGPLNTPTLVTNEADLIRAFGPPVLTDYGLLSAIRFLRKGNRLIYLRVADLDPATGAVEANARVFGAIKAVGSVTFDTATNPTDGETIVIDDGDNPAVTFEFDDDSSVIPTSYLRQVVIGATAFDTMANLVAAIQAATLDVAVFPVPGQEPEISIVATTAGTAANNVIVTTGAAISVTGLAGGADAPTHLVTVSAASPGTWGNTIQIQVIASQALGASPDDRDIFVLAAPDVGAAPQVVERFNNVSLDPESPRFLEAVLAEGIQGEVPPSQYVRADVVPIGPLATVDTGVLTIGTYSLGSAGNTVGRDGILTLDFADYVGSVVGQIPTGLKALRNPERVEFNLLAVPGVSHAAVINEIFDLANYRADFLAIIDPPFGLDRDQVIAWHNGASIGVPNAPTTPMDISYGTLNWSWIRDDDPYSKKSIFLPPSGFVAANVAMTDRVAAPWFPVAGHNRGRLDGREVEYSPTQGDRDLLCPSVGGSNRVNPIVNFQDTGITLFGNRTLQRKPTALDSVHIRRMVLHAQKLIATSVKYLTFEPNEPTTWRRFTLLVNPILEYIASNSGLEEFRVICDASTNPPIQRSNKTMRAKLLLKPIDAAEIIQLDFSLFAAGAEFSEL